MLQSQWELLPPISTTIADGVRGGVMKVPFSIIRDLVPQVFLVSEEQIVNSMKRVYQSLKLAIEPSAAVAPAVALFNSEFKKLLDGRPQNVGIILEGGNVDTGSSQKMMPWICC
jgi:threonine dehydratase